MSEQMFQSGSSNTVTITETTVFDALWKPLTEFPKFYDDDNPMDRGHEMRSPVLWLYQPAHESKHYKTEEVTVWPGHIYLGMCIRPLIKTTEGYDYGEPYFIDLAHRSICAVTMWRYLDRPNFPYDELKAKGEADGTLYNPEFHKGDVVRDEGTPSNFA